MRKKTKVVTGLAVGLGLLSVLAGVNATEKHTATSTQPLSASQLQRLTQSTNAASQAQRQDHASKNTSAQWQAQWRKLVATHKLQHTDSLKHFVHYYHMSPARYLAQQLGYSVNQALQLVPTQLQTAGERQQTATLTKN